MMLSFHRYVSRNPHNYTRSDNRRKNNNNINGYIIAIVYIVMYALQKLHNHAYCTKWVVLWHQCANCEVAWEEGPAEFKVQVYFGTVFFYTETITTEDGALFILKIVLPLSFAIILILAVILTLITVILLRRRYKYRSKYVANCIVQVHKCLLCIYLAIKWHSEKCFSVVVQYVYLDPLFGSFTLL